MTAPMTVANLIAELQKLNPEALVLIECEDAYYNSPLTADAMSMAQAYKGPRGWMLEDFVREDERTEAAAPCLRIYVEGQQ